MKTHRDEKQSRSSTAAIRVETLANEAAQDLAGATGESRPEGHHETDAAEYENGQVSLKGNPLKTTNDILCPRCHLPRLLYPIDGIGARKPDPGITYCKKHPYINKPGCDIYGQMWVAPGPGRGKKKKDFDKKISAAISAATTGIDSGGGTATEQRPPNVLSFPSATCSKCKRCILVSRLNNHMGSCIGNSGRNASRAAAAKISNGGNGGSMASDNTPPASQKGTPLPSSQGSPRKRDADDFDEDGGYEDGDVSGHGHGHGASSKPTKKKFKASASGPGNGNTASASLGQGLSVSLSKKLTLKMRNASGSSSTDASPAPFKKKTARKPDTSLGTRKFISNYDDDDDDDEEGDDDDNEEDNDNSRDYIDDAGDDDYDDNNTSNRGSSHTSYSGSNHGNRHRGSSTKLDAGDDDDDDGDVHVRGSINYKAPYNSSSLSSSNPLKMKKKKLLGSSANTAMSAGSSPLKKTTKVPIPVPGTNGNPKKVKVVNKTPLSPPASKNGRARDMDAGSESSGTMSSPRS